MANLETLISDQAIQFAINDALKPLQNPQPLYRAWAEYLEGLAVRAMRAEVEPFGGPYAQLAPLTVARKTRNTILRETGALFDSIVGQAIPDGASVGSNQSVGPYSLLAIHHFGAPARNIPSRRALPMDIQGNILPQAAEELEALLIDFLNLS